MPYLDIQSKRNLQFGADLFSKLQLLDVQNDDIVEEKHADNLELEARDIATWEKTNGLWVVLQEHRLKVLCYDHDREVSGHCGRHSTPELVSRIFM